VTRISLLFLFIEILGTSFRSRLDLRRKRSPPRSVRCLRFHHHFAVRIHAPFQRLRVMSTFQKLDILNFTFFPRPSPRISPLFWTRLIDLKRDMYVSPLFDLLEAASFLFVSPSGIDRVHQELPLEALTFFPSSRILHPLIASWFKEHCRSSFYFSRKCSFATGPSLLFTRTAPFFVFRGHRHREVCMLGHSFDVGLVDVPPLPFAKELQGAE